MIPENVRKGIEESVARTGAQVIDMIIRGEKGTRVVEVFVDSEEGVTTELCSSISRDISAVIDEGALLQGAYRLEISSPGIDRPLRYPWQYRKHVGRALQVRAHVGEETQTVSGVLVAVETGGIVLRGGKKGPDQRILFGDMLEVRVKAPW